MSQAISIETTFQQSSRQVFASLVCALGDFELAEDALQEAFTAALEQWPRDGVPQNPISWLISAGRFKAIDRIRRDTKLGKLAPELTQRIDSIQQANANKSAVAIEDDRLRLIFTCCHPAIDPSVQIPLTLREVCGLSTEEIAKAFLVSTSTMAQRLVRGKAKIRDARIPIAIPEADELPARLEGVLSVIYLIFNEGYSASSGESLTRSDLSSEAIRLGRLVLDLLDDHEVRGLLALMLLHESRRASRTDANGDIILLEQQDRTRWDQELIQEGKQLVEQNLYRGEIGPYTLQATISAVHASAKTAEETDWTQIVAIYDRLRLLHPSPVVELNRAVALAMRDGPAEGLKLIDAILAGGELNEYTLAHAARGELLIRLGQFESAREALELALSLSNQASEQRFLAKKLADLTPS